MEPPQKAFIEKIRREKFSIGAERPNPLAGTLHEAIRHLSAELYQKDTHFISELIQNAEDNSYEEGVQPELYLVLTRADVTGVGAPATLIFFNNELGFQERNIAALCSIGQSTKKGQRNEGYIGERGIGFKSVFVVTSTPYVISNGFRICFCDSAEESAGSAAGIGYIVPNWVERPTDDELRCFWRSAAGEERSLPKTIIVLPLQPQKVASVEAELKHIYPETILFVRRITRLRIREETEGKVHQEMIVGRSDSPRVSNGDDATGFVTTLSVLKRPGHIIEARDYFVWEQRFDAFAPVEQRKEVKTWVITLAFPLQDRIAGGSRGNVYAFLPSQMNSGFPFLINADFLLVSSRESLKFDSPWNQGILSCVAIAFCKAMGTLLQRSDARGVSLSRISASQVYKYVPVKTCNVHLESVQEKILSDLGRQDTILVATNVGSRTQYLCNPSMSRRVDERFRGILERALNERNVPTIISNSNYFVVNGSVQANYSEALDQLGVPWMQSLEYLQILSESNWLLSLSDDLYLEVLAFISVVLPYIGTQWERSVVNSRINNLKLVRYEESSSIKLISIDKINELKMALFISPPQQESHLSKWIERFAPWIVYRFMPQQTVIAMDKAETTGTTHEGVKWLRTKASVREIDVKSFALELVGRCTKEKDEIMQQPRIAANFLLLVWRFVYTSVQEGRLKGSPRETRYLEFAVVDESGHVQWINPVEVQAGSTGPLVLLPRSCSMWPLLLTYGAWSDHADAIIRLSDAYLNLHDNSRRGEYEQESCKVFLQDNFGASDLPDLPLLDVPFPQLTSLSSKQSRLLLQWLSRLGGKSMDALIKKKKLWLSLKTTAWLHTEEHGLQCPDMCFMPNHDLQKFFHPSEVPFVDESYYGDVNPYSEILHKMGAVHCCKAGCEALAKQIKVLKDRAGTRIDKEQMIKFYTYLRIYKWQPTENDRASMEIFIPAGTGRQPSWQSPQFCVIEDPEDLFRGVLPILRDIYPDDLLPFFERVLGVPRTVTSARYLDCWIYWRENMMQYDSQQCAQLWEKIALNWQYCQPCEKQKFKAKAAVLTETNSGELQFTSPDSVVIPDDLQLRSLFITHFSKSLFVWYPKGCSKIEAELNSIYAHLGAKRLSDCVEVISDINFETLSSCSMHSTPKFITPGLLVAILGFISNPEYAFSSERRQSVITSLCGSAEKEMSDPCRIVYRMTSSALEVTAVERHLFGFCDVQGVIHRLADTHELLTDAANVREMETQVLESICSKILADSPTTGSSLVDFLKLLVGSRFDEAAVEYELRRKNLKLYSEDLEFLVKSTKPFTMTEVNLRVFQSLQLL